MSQRQLSDAQLDALLGQAPNPPEPSGGLAEQIMVRAGATPQRPANRFVPSPRHRRRRPFVWTTIIAANALAAAAAASSWDGQRFDFHRLADLPHRVAAAIHLPHHRFREPERAEQRRTMLHGRPAVPAFPAVPARTAQPPKIRQVAIPVTASLGMRTPGSSLHQRGQVAVASARHPSRWLPRHAGLGKIKTVHEIAPMPAFGRQTIRHSPGPGSVQAVQPKIGEERPVERSVIQDQTAAPPRDGDRGQFSGRFGNNWRRFAPGERANPRRAGVGRQQRWASWGRDLRRPRRSQGRRFARRF